MSFERLVKIMETLRGTQGCPWDREQTRDSLRPFLLEEVYELLEALDEDDPEKIKEELGDLLFQIVFHCQIAEEAGQFAVQTVIQDIADKMVSRHPHVFGKDKVRSPEEVHHTWEEIKKKEGKGRGSLMEGVPKKLPALIRAQRLQHKASRVGFDWDRVEDVFEKLDEELSELKRALEKKDQSSIEDEIGDILFVLVRIANFVRVNPEDALRKTIKKFIHRFRHIEKKAAEQGKRLSDMNLEEMEFLWQEAKGDQQGSQTEEK
jgi:tetrapyrrole methylase family protein/MazG family protein